MKSLIQSIINENIPENSRCITGYANLANLLAEPISGYKSAFVIGMKYPGRVIDEIEQGPTISYFNEYHAINSELDTIIKTISKKLTEHNITNLPITPTSTDAEINSSPDYSRTLRTLFSHKMAGTRAGLGWIGKTDLFISTEFGPRIRMASLLLEETNLPFGTPITESRCKNCNLCVKKCPAQAANGKSWTVDIDRDEFYDALKCREMCLSISKRRIDKDISLCGICVSVCPFGKN